MSPPKTPPKLSNERPATTPPPVIATALQKRTIGAQSDTKGFDGANGGFHEWAAAQVLQKAVDEP